MNVDKENRPPPGMVAELKKRLTPGRTRRQTQDQYFDVGKVGRKTGVVLPDKGVRDEHGMEPMSGIFDSPVKTSPQRNSDRTLASSDMLVQQSSAPSIHDTLYLSKTPRLPPARAATPKHTHIGSPKRMSTGRKPQEQQPHTTGKALATHDEDRSPAKALSRTQPPANRVLDFVKEKESVRPSIEEASPFKPRKALRRSLQRENPFASPAQTRKKPRSESVAEAERTLEETALLLSTSDAPLMVEEDPFEPVHEVDDEDVEEEEELVASPMAQESDMPGDSTDLVNELLGSTSPSELHETLRKKRDRTSMQAEDTEIDAKPHQAQYDSHGSVSPERKKQRTRPRTSESVIYQDDEPEPTTVDPSMLSQSESSVLEAEPSMPPPKTKGKGKGKAKSKSKAKAPKALQSRDPNRPRSKTPGSPVKLNDDHARTSRSPSKARANGRGMSVGPNFILRATTPYDDAISTSRSGRPVIKPLQYWANESRIWKNGECEGIIRADEIFQPTAKPKKKAKGKGRKSVGGRKLDDIAEEDESEAESVAADEWEEDLGVISGTVASWDSERQMADSGEPIKEDLAFARPSITTRDVSGSEFKYAKILTMPFFGAGVVELPPEGFKRAKNSRKMQMVFFVHEGKVMVDIGAQGMVEKQVNTFAITKGGCWVVPRGKLALSFIFVSSRLLGDGEDEVDSDPVETPMDLDSEAEKAVAHRLLIDPAAWTMLLTTRGNIHLPGRQVSGHVEAVCATRCQFKPLGRRTA
ncbi:mitotic fidelity of chromosome transmission-related protein [Elasticomyces elasticus]|nr:mitotic fidelity of chromosome transmission-related protein [Elasticomyces elasticus]